MKTFSFIKHFPLLFLAILMTSCISLRKAPSIATHKIATAKKFQRKFPRETAFIFEDPKDADKFYNFINTKFELNDMDVGFDVPISINKVTYYLTYHEAEIPNKKLNLLGLAVDASLKIKGLDPIFQDGYVEREGHWFLAITIYDSDGKNCLKRSYPARKIVLDYLRLLQNEYLNTSSF